MISTAFRATTLPVLGCIAIALALAPSWCRGEGPPAWYRMYNEGAECTPRLPGCGRCEPIPPYNPGCSLENPRGTGVDDPWRPPHVWPQTRYPVVPAYTRPSFGYHETRWSILPVSDCYPVIQRVTAAPPIPRPIPTPVPAAPPAAAPASNGTGPGAEKVPAARPPEVAPEMRPLPTPQIHPQQGPNPPQGAPPVRPDTGPPKATPPANPPVAPRAQRFHRYSDTDLPRSDEGVPTTRSNRAGSDTSPVPRTAVVPTDDLPQIEVRPF